MFSNPRRQYSVVRRGKASASRPISSEKSASSIGRSFISITKLKKEIPNRRLLAYSQFTNACNAGGVTSGMRRLHQTEAANHPFDSLSLSNATMGDQAMA